MVNGNSSLAASTSEPKFTKGVLSLILTGGVFVICITMLIVYFSKNANAQEDIKSIVELKNSIIQETSVPALSGGTDTSGNGENVGGILPEYRELAEKNPDLVGWIKIPNTNIDYPVMQLNNEYYLYRNFEGEYSAIGLPFLDERCDLSTEAAPKLIYGHNTKSGALFHDLLLYADSSFLANHAVIQFDTLYERRTYEVTSSERFDDRDLQPELDGEGDTLMLITCSYHSDVGRFAVYAKRSEVIGK